MAKVTVPIAYNRTGQRIGGLNKNDEPVGFNGQFSPYMKNFVVESSFIRKRMGYSAVGSNLPLTGVGTGLFKYTDARGVIHLIATTVDKAYIYNASTDEWDDITPTLGLFTGADDARFRFAVATDTGMFTNNGGSALVISNNTNDLQYYEGHANDKFKVLVHGFTSFAKCADIVEFWNHFFIFNYNNGANNVRSLAYTDTGDINGWGGTGGITILTDSVGSILRAKKLGLDVAIYSTESISVCRYTGGATLFAIPTLIFETGLLGPDALWAFTDYHVFIGSDQRVHKYSGSNRTEDVGATIDCALFRELSYAYKNRITAGYDPQRKKLYFFIPTASYTNPKCAYVLSPDMYGGPWEYHEFSHGVCAFAVLESSTSIYCDTTGWATRYCDQISGYCDDSYGQASSPICVFITDDGYVFKLDELTGKDHETDISCEYQTEDITLDEELTFDRWNSVSFVSESLVGTSVYVSYSTDGGDNFTALTDSPISVSGKWNTYTLPLDVASRKIRFKFYESSSSDLKFRESIHIAYTEQTSRD